MKFFPLLILFFFFTISIFAQSSSYKLTEGTTIKDPSGKKIDLYKFQDLMATGDYMMVPVNGKDGKLDHMQLRKASKEERGQMTAMIRGSRSERIGKPAPSYEMTDMEGRKLSSKSLKGKIVVLNFWFTACGPCIDEVPALNKVYQKYKSNKDVVFAAVTFDRESRINSFQVKYKLKYPIVANAQGVVDRFQNKGYPTNAIIDKAGKYYYYRGGGHPGIAQDLIASLDRAIAGKPPITESPRPPRVTQKETIHLKDTDTFKLENGKEIDVDKAFDLLASNNYEIEQKSSYFLIKKRSSTAGWTTTSSGNTSGKTTKPSSSKSKKKRKKKKRKRN